MTCNIPEHAELEKMHKWRGTAFFQLQRNLQCASVANPVDSEAAVLTAEEVEEMEVHGGLDAPSSLCPDKPDTGIHKIRAVFGRRRTHNEQIMVHPCGIIVARRTFFGSETTPQTVVSRLKLPFTRFLRNWPCTGNDSLRLLHQRVNA